MIIDEANALLELFVAGEARAAGESLAAEQARQTLLTFAALGLRAAEALETGVGEPDCNR